MFGQIKEKTEIESREKIKAPTVLSQWHQVSILGVYKYELDIIIYNGAVSKDHHIKLQRFSAEQTTFTFSHQKATQMLKNWPLATDEKMKKHSERKRRGRINCLIFRPSNLWLIGDYTLCLCLWPCDLQRRETWCRMKTDWHTHKNTHSALSKTSPLHNYVQPESDRGSAGLWYNCTAIPVTGLLFHIAVDRLQCDSKLHQQWKLTFGHPLQIMYFPLDFCLIKMRNHFLSSHFPLNRL